MASCCTHLFVEQRAAIAGEQYYPLSSSSNYPIEVAIFGRGGPLERVADRGFSVNGKISAQSALGGQSPVPPFVERLLIQYLNDADG